MEILPQIMHILPRVAFLPYVFAIAPILIYNETKKKKLFKKKNHIEND